jgi:Tfp pilus assembly protein PilV
MSHPEGAPDPPPQVATATAALSAMQIVAEAAVGYHKKLIDGGVPEESAGRMTEEFHTQMMAAMNSGIKRHQDSASSRAAQPRRPR